MNLIARFKRSWQIFLASLQLIKAQPRLMLFPIVTIVASLLIAAFFLLIPLAAFALQDTGHGLTDPAHWQALVKPGLQHRLEESYGSLTLAIGTPLYAILIYLVSMFIATFSNVACYHQIMRAFAGEQVSLRAGFSFAKSRLVAILMWSMLASTVGLLIQAIAERAGLLGTLIMRFLGLIWSVASLFVIPVLVREDCRNPVKALRSSVSLLRETWGEALIGFVGLGILHSVVFFALLLVAAVFGVTALALATFIKAKVLVLFFIVAVALLIVAFIAYSFLLSLATEIYRCALYIYASEGEIPGSFDKELLDSAWKMKKA